MAYHYKVKELKILVDRVLEENPEATLEIGIKDGNGHSTCGDIIDCHIGCTLFREPNLRIEIDNTSYDI